VHKMSDVLHIESPDCKSQITEGDCKSESTSVTDGESFRRTENTEVNVPVL